MLSHFLLSLRALTPLSLVIRLLMAVLFGGIIGAGRGKARHAAGLRTHILVCMGSASVMIVNLYLVQELGLTTDAARLGAQVISGIGFLGAGTIIVTGRYQIRGLTTAAGLWASACMGLAVGAGYFEAALLMLLLMVIVLVGLNRLDDAYVRRPSVVSLFLEYDSSMRFSSILQALRDYGYHVSNLEYFHDTVPEVVQLQLELQLADGNRPLGQVLQQIRGIPGVLFAEDL